MRGDVLNVSRKPMAAMMVGIVPSAGGRGPAPLMSGRAIPATPSTTGGIRQTTSPVMPDVQVVIDEEYGYAVKTVNGIPVTCWRLFCKKRPHPSE